jgi:hypothetical protein
MEADKKKTIVIGFLKNDFFLQKCTNDENIYKISQLVYYVKRILCVCSCFVWPILFFSPADDMLLVHQEPW